jgi:hypothetical protein
MSLAESQPSAPAQRQRSKFQFLMIGCILAILVVETAGVCLGATKVGFDENQVMVINGKKVFPIGVSLPPPPDGMTPWGKNGLEELADAGVMFLRTGLFGRPWDEAAITQEQKYFDAAAKCGIYCIPNLRELARLQEGDTAGEKMQRRLMNLLKDQPAMGVWKGVDEPLLAVNRATPETMMRAYRTIREIDPNHPVWVVHSAGAPAEQVKEFNATCDILGADVYPIRYPNEKNPKALKKVSAVGEVTQKMMKLAEAKKPVWLTLQIAWSGVLPPKHTLRFPTFPEERFMTYQAIINGARGIVYFGGHWPESLSGEDARLGWNWGFWQRVLRPVVVEIGNKSPLAPALVAAESKMEVKVEGGEGIEWCVREAGDEVFILACKREGETVPVKFRGLPQKLREGTVLFEEPRKVKVEGGSFTDWFGPLEVHVYRFRNQLER